MFLLIYTVLILISQLTGLKAIFNSKKVKEVNFKKTMADIEDSGLDKDTAISYVMFVGTVATLFYSVFYISSVVFLGNVYLVAYVSLLLTRMVRNVTAAKRALMSGEITTSSPISKLISLSAIIYTVYFLVMYILHLI